MKLTEKAIERLKKPDQRTDIRDDSTRGLYLRCQPTGTKSWRYRYQLRGKTRILTLGNWPDKGLADARAEATEYARKILKGEDPAADAQKAEAERQNMPTVAEFVDEYIERYAKPKKKSWKQDQQILSRWIVPRVGLLRLDEVTRRDIVGALDACRDTGATRQPGKVLAATRMMFKVAIQRGILESTPCSFIEETQPEPTQRAMTEAQIRHWWNATGEAIESEDPAIQKPAALALRVLLLTGQRPGEVAEMRRDELHLDSDLGPHWIIPAERRKKGRAKTGKPHAVALEPEAISAIQAALDYSGSEYVFEKASGGPIRTDSHMAKGLARIFPDDHPTPHAARHTVATELAELGVDEYHVGRVLGHVSKSVTGTVYINHRINEPALNNQRTLLAAWQDRLLEITEGKERQSNIVSFEASA